MDGYVVESPSLKEVRKLITKGEWNRSKSQLKDLLKDDKFRGLCQIDKCFIARFLGEKYKSERKFGEALRLHRLYCAVARGLAVEEQRAFATLGSTFHDSALFASNTNEKATALDEAEKYTLLAVKSAKQLLADESAGIGRAEAGHMMSRGLFNLALIELSRNCGESSLAKAVACLEKAVRVFKEYVAKSSAGTSTEVDFFQASIYQELALLYRQSHRLTELWQTATDGVQLAEKLLGNSTDGRSRVKARRMIAKFLMHKAFASLGECHFDIAARLAGEALKTLVSDNNKSNCGSRLNAKRRRIAKNEYAAEEDFDEQDEDDDDEEGEGGVNNLSQNLSNFKRTCCKLAKAAKKLSSVQRSNPGCVDSDLNFAKISEKIADLLFDVGIFEQAEKCYRQALVRLPISSDNRKQQLGLVVSIARCLLSLGPRGDSYDKFISQLKDQQSSAQQFGRFRAQGDDFIGLYEAAVDHFVECSKLESFKKYFNFEIDARRFSRSNSEFTLMRRIAEISKEIDASVKTDVRERFKEALNSMLAELNISEHDVAIAVENLSNSSGSNGDDDDSSSGSGSDLSEGSGSDSDADSDGGSDGEQSNRRKQRDFKPVRLKRNEKGETQLHVACRMGSVAKAEQLLKAGHPVNIRDGSGWFPLHDAADAGCSAIVALLLANGADINCVNDLNGLTPGMEAAKNGHLPDYRAVLRVIVANKGVNCDAKDSRARTIIHFLRESRRENESVMSSADLADWMEVESLVLGKMRKPPTASMKPPTTGAASSSSMIAPLITSTAIPKRVSSDSDVSHRSSINSKSNRLLDDEQSSVSSSDENDLPPLSSANNNNNPVSLYQSAMGNVGRSAKSKSSNKRKVDGKQSEALTSLVANDPFLDENDARDDEWLVDDVGNSVVTVNASGSRRPVASKRRSKDKNNNNSNKTTSKNVCTSQQQDPLTGSMMNGSKADDALALLGDDDDDAPFGNIDSLLRNESPIADFSTSLAPVLQPSIAPSLRNDSFMMRNKASTSSQSLASHHHSSSSSSFIPSSSAAHHHSSNSDYLTIRVHLEREGSNRRDSLLINNIESGDSTWNIQKLRQEVKTRYAALFGQMPIISTMRLLDGTILADDSRLEPISRLHGELIAVVDRWDLPPLYNRYTAACALSCVAPSSSLEPALAVAENSGRVDLSHMLLASSQVRCVLKALNYQTNVTSITLAGNDLDGSIAKPFVEMLVTLPNLVELDLSLSGLTVDGLEQIAQALLSHQSKMLAGTNTSTPTATTTATRLRRLNLSYNNFLPQFWRTGSHHVANASVASRLADSLSTLLGFFSSSLRRLSMVSCELDGELLLQGSHERLVLGEMFKGLRELTEIDLSHNRLGFSGVEFLLTRALPLNQLTSLKLIGPLSFPPTTPAAAFGRLVEHILLSCSKLVELSISSNGISDADVLAFAPALANAQSLTELDLSANPQLEMQGFADLARHLYRCKTLVRIDLGSTGISSPIDKAFDYLADKMDSGGPLTELVLPEKTLSASDVENLRQILNCSAKGTGGRGAYVPSCSLLLI